MEKSQVADKKKVDPTHAAAQDILAGGVIMTDEDGQKKTMADVANNNDALGPPVQSSTMPSTSSGIAHILSRGNTLGENKMRPLDPIPEVEWWDAALLPPGRKSFNKSEGQHTITEADLLMKRITDLVQHPTAVKSEYTEKLNSSAIEVLPTDNNLRILSKEADQSKMAEERTMGHPQHNLGRKLTPQQRRDKMKRKLNRDLNEECRTALFRIETLVCPTHRFKVDVNAQQYMLTGLCIIPDKALSHRIPTMVVVEGGPWAIKKYKRLLLRRMKWESPAGGLAEEERALMKKQLEGNRSALVWEGVLKKPIFGGGRSSTSATKTRLSESLPTKSSTATGTR